MSIYCPVVFHDASDDEFSRVDRIVMGCAFDCHNEMGRLCDEKNYEKDLAARLVDRGVEEVLTQVPVEVHHGSFQRTYRLDLVVNRIIYELKTVESFNPRHDAQCIHYSILTGSSRVKLLNFRTAKVKGLLKRASPFALSKRSETPNLERWSSWSANCDSLLEYISSLVEEFGPSLISAFYADAATVHFGGEFRCVRRIPLTRRGLDLGHQKYRCHTNTDAFIVSSLSSGVDAYEKDLRKRLQLTPLRSLQWFNLGSGRLTAVTIENGK